MLSLVAVVMFTYYHKHELARVLTLSVRNSLVVRDIRQAVMGLENPSGLYFSSIGFFDRNQAPVFTLPPEINSKSFNGHSVWFPVLEFPVTEDQDGKAKIGVLKFSFLPYEFTPYAFGIWLTALLASFPLVRRARKRIIQTHQDALKNQRAETFSLLARQVVHDIRSPVASLVSVGHTANGLDEVNRVNLRNAINQIRDIANSLLQKGKNQEIAKIGGLPEVEADLSGVNSTLSHHEPKRTEWVSDLIETTLSQKRLQYADQKNIRIEYAPEESYGLFVEIQPTEFSRLLSNLINNAVEAMPQGGEIYVTTKVSIAGSSGQKITIEVRDTGKGMPPEVLIKLGQRGFTHGKGGTESGSGLGVFHAFEAVKSWGGQLMYESAPRKGTRAIIALPRSDAPRWFAEAIEISSPSSTVVILDDVPGIHSIWKNRFALEAPHASLLHFHSAEELLKWFRQSLGSMVHPLYLCDYELRGSRQNGLELIEMLGIASESVLVTNRADEQALRDHCEKMGLRLLPKCLSPFVPIRVRNC